MFVGASGDLTMDNCSVPNMLFNVNIAQNFQTPKITNSKIENLYFENYYDDKKQFRNSANFTFYSSNEINNLILAEPNDEYLLDDVSFGVYSKIFNPLNSKLYSTLKLESLLEFIPSFDVQQDYSKIFIPPEGSDPAPGGDANAENTPSARKIKAEEKDSLIDILDHNTNQLYLEFVNGNYVLTAKNLTYCKSEEKQLDGYYALLWLKLPENVSISEFESVKIDFPNSNIIQAKSLVEIENGVTYDNFISHKLKYLPFLINLTDFYQYKKIIAMNISFKFKSNTKTEVVFKRYLDLTYKTGVYSLSVNFTTGIFGYQDKSCTDNCGQVIIPQPGGTTDVSFNMTDNDYFVANKGELKPSKNVNQLNIAFEESSNEITINFDNVAEDNKAKLDFQIKQLSENGNKLTLKTAKAVEVSLNNNEGYNINQPLDIEVGGSVNSVTMNQVTLSSNLSLTQDKNLTIGDLSTKGTSASIQSNTIISEKLTIASPADLTVSPSLQFAENAELNLDIQQINSDTKILLSGDLPVLPPKIINLIEAKQSQSTLLEEAPRKLTILHGNHINCEEWKAKFANVQTFKYKYCELVGETKSTNNIGNYNLVLSQDDPSSNGDKLSGGAIAGIVIACIVVVAAVVVVLVYFLVIKKKDDKSVGEQQDVEL